MIIYQDWLVRNSQRKFPLDDSALGVDDNGEVLPDEFLLDANIWIPKYVYSISPLRELKYVYISSAAVTNSLVSVTFLGSALPAMPVSEDPPDESEIFVPLGVISITRPISPYRNYPITPLLVGVKGWVAFGEGTADAETRFTMKFSEPRQTLLAPRTTRFFYPFPISAAQILGGFQALDGDITLQGVEPLFLETRTVLVGGQPKTAIVFNLDRNVETFSAFAGPCGGRPESETCNKTPITSLGGVTPDCDGNIQIEFDDLSVRWLEDGTGFCIDSDIEIEDICASESALPNEDGILKSEYAWARPCEQTPPYTAPLTDVGLEDNFVPQAGSWFADAGKVYGVPSYEMNMIGPCIASFASAITSRQISTTLSLPSGVVGGLFIMAQGLRRIITREGKLIKQTSYGEEEEIGAAGTTLTITDGAINGIPVSDAFWQPQGACGVWIQIDAGYTFGYAEISAFTIADA